MELHPKLRPVFDKINFIKRYEELTKLYRDSDNRFEKYDNQKVKETIESFGYKTRYYRSENFFMIKEEKQDFEFQFNMKFKYAACELIWGLKKGEEHWNLGGPWGYIADLIAQVEEPLPLPLPIFTSYDDLKSILTEAFNLYEDFKKVLLEQEYGTVS